MKNFIGNFLASLSAFIVGLVIVGFVNVLIFAGLVAGLGSGKSVPVVVQDSTILTINMKTVFREGTTKDVFNIEGQSIEIDLSLDEDNSVDYLKAVNCVLGAVEDDRIIAINLKPDGMSMNLAQLVEFREALALFAAKKPVYVFTETFESLGSYFLSNVADSLVMGRLGHIPWVGLSTTSTHIKGLIDKLGADVEVFRCGKFKSAVEPYTEKKMSAENRKQTELMLNTVWKYIVANTAQARKVKPEELNNLASELSIASAQDALNHKFIDKIADSEQYQKMLANLYDGDEKSIKSISLKDYMSTMTMDYQGKGEKKNIAIIYANGQIMPSDYGLSDELITAKDMLERLKTAEKDSTVKAVVLRINSPGGSALDSEVICAQVERLRKVKPVVVSMGDMAASGGYYIAAPADRIIATPMTLTGSIGVFSLGVNIQGALNKQLGLTFDNVKTNKSADFGFGKMTQAQRNYIQKSVDDIYMLFKQRVSEGRNLTMDQVESVASGRVWTGVDAHKNGLVDEMGGLLSAIECARVLAHIEGEFTVNEISSSRDAMEALKNSLKPYIKSQNELPLIDETIKHLKTVISMSGKVQAITPVVLTIN